MRSFKHLVNALLVMLTSAILAGTTSSSAFGQLDYNPYGGLPDSVGGFAARELGRLRARSIGRGYSGSQINRNTLSRSFARVPDYGVADRSVLPNASRSAQSLLSSPVTSTGPPRSSAARFGTGSPLSSKPFSNAVPTPTVSPYLNLFREDITDDVLPNYNTLVRPQLQQQAFNEQVRRQEQSTNRRIQALSSQPAFNPQGSIYQAPTGHSTSFFNLGRFYPSAGRR